MPFQTASDITSHLRKVLSKTRREDEREHSSSTKSSRQEQVGAGESTNKGEDRNLSPRASSPDIDNIEASEGEEEDGAFEFERNAENSLPHPIYSQGSVAYEDNLYKVFVKAVRHKKPTRYSLSDHLFNIWVESKLARSRQPPLLFDLEYVLEKALVEILDRLKAVYHAQENQNQIYITVLEHNMLNGLNTGNYSLNTPAIKIVRWVLSMLYHFLKSNQTIRLNDSFKIQIKVLSLRHTQALEKKRRGFVKHLYH